MTGGNGIDQFDDEFNVKFRANSLKNRLALADQKRSLNCPTHCGQVWELGEAAIAPDVATELEFHLNAQADAKAEPAVEEWPGICSDMVFYTGSDEKTKRMLRSYNLVFAECDGKTMGEIREALYRARPEELKLPCESFLRDKLDSELLTVNGPFDNLTIGELIETL